MTWTQSSGSWDFAARLRERGLRMVDAPVSGGSEGAKNATLTIFVGGDERDVELARPVLNALGRTITHVGPIGAGQAVKAVNQVILAGAYLGVAEGMVLAIKAGLDVEQVVPLHGRVTTWDELLTAVDTYGHPRSRPSSDRSTR